jgi:hypothetical protein
MNATVIPGALSAPDLPRFGEQPLANDCEAFAVPGRGNPPLPARQA